MLVNYDNLSEMLRRFRYTLSFKKLSQKLLIRVLNLSLVSSFDGHVWCGPRVPVEYMCGVGCVSGMVHAPRYVCRPRSAQLYQLRAFLTRHLTRPSKDQTSRDGLGVSSRLFVGLRDARRFPVYWRWCVLVVCFGWKLMNTSFQIENCFFSCSVQQSEPYYWLYQVNVWLLLLFGSEQFVPLTLKVVPETWFSFNIFFKSVLLLPFFNSQEKLTLSK